MVSWDPQQILFGPQCVWFWFEGRQVGQAFSRFATVPSIPCLRATGTLAAWPSHHLHVFSCHLGPLFCLSFVRITQGRGLEGQEDSQPLPARPQGRCSSSPAGRGHAATRVGALSGRRKAHGQRIIKLDLYSAMVNAWNTTQTRMILESIL